MTRNWIWVLLGLGIVLGAGILVAALSGGGGDSAASSEAANCLAHHSLTQCHRLYPGLYDRPDVTRATTTTSEPPTTTTTVPIASLQAQIASEVQAACLRVTDSEVELGAAANTLMVSYGSEWAPTGVSAEQLSGRIGACVESAFAAAQSPNVDAIVKNPDAVNGQLFLMVVDISQFDAATGACGFRGYWDTQAHEYNFDYAGDNAVFAAGDGATTCPVLSGVDQNDVVRVWAQSKGSTSYDTQIGGSTTAPLFRVLRAQIIRKA